MFPNLPWKNSVKKRLNLSGKTQKGFFQSVKEYSENLSSVRKSVMESSGKFSKSVTELLYNINFGNVPWVIREECFSNLSWTTQENFTISHGQLGKFLETVMDPQNYKWQNGKAIQGKTIYVQSASAQRVRQNFLGNGRLTSSAPLPPPTPSG